MAASGSVSSKYPDSCKISLSGLTSSISYTFTPVAELNGSYFTEGTSWSVRGKTSSSKSITWDDILEPGSYRIRIHVDYTTSGGYEDSTDFYCSGSYSVSLESISLSVSNITTDSATFTIDSGDNSDYWEYFRYALYDDDGRQVYVYPSNTSNTTTYTWRSHTVTGLNPGTTYTYSCNVAVYSSNRANASSYLGYESDEVTFTTISRPTRTLTFYTDKQTNLKITSENGFSNGDSYYWIGPDHTTSTISGNPFPIWQEGAYTIGWFTQISVYEDDYITLRAEAIDPSEADSGHRYNYELAGLYRSTFSNKIGTTTNNGSICSYNEEVGDWDYTSIYARSNPISQYYVNAMITSGTTGINSVSPKNQWCDEGSSIEFSATVASGYIFDKWQENNGSFYSSSNPYTYTVSAPLTLYALAKSSSSRPDAYYWLYHGCNIYNGTPLSTTTTGKPGFKWNPETIVNEPAYKNCYGGYITAEEWNGLIDRLLEWKKYYEKDDYVAPSVTRAVRGRPLTAAMYNQVRNIINDIIDSQGMTKNKISSVTKDSSQIGSYDLNILVTTMNDFV